MNKITLHIYKLKKYFRAFKIAAYFVDLGLPSGTLWMYTPLNYNRKYMWGDLKGSDKDYNDLQDDISWQNTPFNGGKNDYNHDFDVFLPLICDKKRQLRHKYDVAYKKYQGIACMPTVGQFRELIEYTEAFKNKDGIKLISKVNANVIVLPYISLANHLVRVWSRNLQTNEIAYCLESHGLGCYIEKQFRGGYANIIPVINKNGV